MLAKVFILFLSVISLGQAVQAADQPASDQSFADWVLQDQLRPMIHETGNPQSLNVLALGLATTALSFQYDNSVQEQEDRHRTVSQESARHAALLGSGVPGISIALAQLYWDRSNGLMHARSIVMTSATHVSIALLAQKERPNKTNKMSFPSGHTSSSFATAASLGYAYGPWVGVPAYLAAAYVGASRVSDGAHWLSDTIGGAALGIYWASVSAHVQKKSAVTFFPTLSSEGGMISMSYEF